ncbi:MAG: DUF4417 domain-containing protein [Bacteroidales bacterium]|nr:DUF4417 domain-containing protein [Bacteroidales bacterium]
MIPSFFFNGPGDRIYASSNEYGIPSLIKECQPHHSIELPISIWGEKGRSRITPKTYLFYQYDKNTFDRLIQKPEEIVLSGCESIGEVNFTVNDMTPMAIALERTYQKRYIARYVQECGIPVWVDLNVSRRYAEINLIGVPNGYNAFVTRGYSDRIDDLDFEYQLAQRISGKAHPNMAVYGGGQKAEKFCQEHELIYIYDSTTERHVHLREKGGHQ